jgi:GNAT superfamily N-acetyltransferase
VRIREAVDADRTAIVAMGAHFIDRTNYRIVFEELAHTTPALLEQGVDNLLTMLWSLGEKAVVFVADTDEGLAGMIALVSGVHPITRQPYAEEVCWWVEPPFRRGRVGPQLLEVAEAWARASGLVFLKMIEPVPSDVGRFYIAHGYMPIETAYAKVL